MKKVLIPLAGLLATSYCALAILTFTCLFGPSGSKGPGHHHHQTGSAAHSAFCAWACQTSPTSALVVATPSIRPVLGDAVLLRSLETVSVSLVLVFIPSRAPPR